MMADAEPATGDARSPARLFALKQGDTFVVADAFGDITGEGDGLFHDDTRLLSRFRLSIGGRPLELLGGAVSEDNVVFTANLTNRPLPPIGGQSTRQGVIHIERTPADLGGSPLRAAAAAQFRPGAGAAAAAPGVRRRFSRHVRGPRPDARRARARPGGCDRRRLGRAQLRGAGRPCARLDSDFRPATHPSRPGLRRLRTDAPAEPAHRHLLRGRAWSPASRPRASASGPRRRKRGWRHGRFGVAAPGCRPPAACSASGSAGRGRIWPCSRPTSRPAPTPMPASPGSRPRSAATPSSRPCSSCGSTHRWRAACCASWRRTRPPKPRASPTPRPARSCTRPARARWPACASCRSANTMAASTPRRCSSCWPAPMPTAPAIWL